MGRAIEVLILSALILTTRCANYRDVLIGGEVYFSDADCYARMMRVRMCAAEPGLIVRHHDFENYPAGTTPHTTAPLDYLILGLAAILKPCTTQPLDLAGALISPVFALLGGWFLWWWSRRMKFAYRWAMLILYAISPILVHGTKLGRPDHQSLLMLLVTIAVCAEWSLWTEPSRSWGVVSGLAWGLAIWVSAYEPLILFVLVVACAFLLGYIQGRDTPHNLFSANRRAGWIAFAATIALALVIERRLPPLPIAHAGAALQNWSHTIGELQSVSPLNPIWFRWTGWLLIAMPILIWLAARKAEPAGATPRPRSALLFILILLAVTFGLTIWQVRWAYFFVSVFVIALPLLLDSIKSRLVVWVAFVLSLLPILRDWDERLWPNDSELARRVEHQNECVGLRDLATTMKSSERNPFMAPWWLSPAISYWSQQPGVGGSSHESLAGILESARFYAATDWQKSREIVENRRIQWIIAYDADRTAESCGAILGEPVSKHALCYVLDRAPAQAPRFLAFAAQNSTGKLFRVANNR